MMRRIGLNFHGIGTPGRALEDGEAPYWVGESLFSEILDRVTQSSDPARYVITFDDGNLSDFSIALPALIDRSLVARFFVLTGRLGTEGSLDEGQLRAMQAAGMEIGSHGIAHIPWSGLDNSALAGEVTRSRARLEEICGQPITAAGIPFGRYDARVLRALRRAGYTTAWSSDGGTMADTGFVRARTSLRGDMTGPEINAILAGYLSPIRRLRRTLGIAKRRRWPLL